MPPNEDVTQDVVLAYHKEKNWSPAATAVAHHMSQKSTPETTLYPSASKYTIK
ncbi:hypothetical protein GcM3_008035 [Golovinomyces cichoracearum]|uniref:Uncharacterized protein n=1 Tax=Golovinomyces cichoracearum TaxID=62708 RepID=A0A420JAJ8_9PEZI|nr:hypothetical protein GcM3_008035 [Golovinomyces cichoracearum]